MARRIFDHDADGSDEGFNEEILLNRLDHVVKRNRVSCKLFLEKEVSSSASFVGAAGDGMGA